MWELADMLATRDIAATLARALEELARDPGRPDAECEALEDLRTQARSLAAHYPQWEGRPVAGPAAILALLERVQLIAGE